jgi:hypothetical protein
MESSQKYTEDRFEIDEYFLKQIKEFEYYVSSKIALKVDELDDVNHTDGEIDVFSSYVNDKNEEPIFFTIEYYKYEDGPVVLIDIFEIELNNYLDQINLKKHI